MDVLEQAGIDSLWLPEMVYGSLVEPFIGMSYALARTQRLKVGTGVAVLPGRHPVLVAKQLASLAGLAPRRVLPVFGLKPARPAELAAFRGAGRPPGRGVRRVPGADPAAAERAGGDASTASSSRSSRASIGPLPAKPLDIWVGGSAPGALRRAGRLADGWLASFLTPAEAGAGRVAIEAAAAEAGREIEPDHFGISLAVATGPALARAARGGPAAPAGHRPGRRWSRTAGPTPAARSRTTWRPA